MKRQTHWMRQVAGGFGLVACCGVMPLAHAQQGWAGSYMGMSVASGRVVIDGTTVKTDGTTGSNASQETAQDLRDQGQGVAVVVGYRKPLESGLLVGLEADLARPGHSISTRNLIAAGTYAGQPSASLQYQMPWLVTTRGVAAWSLGDVLVFGSAGAALATEEVTRTQYRTVTGSNVTAAQFSEVDRQTRLGLALGAGLEWRVSKPWSIRADYLHVRFPAETFRFPDARGGAQGSFSDVQGRVASNRASWNAFRVGVVYGF